MSDLLKKLYDASNEHHEASKRLAEAERAIKTAFSSPRCAYERDPNIENVVRVIGLVKDGFSGMTDGIQCLSSYQIAGVLAAAAEAKMRVLAAALQNLRVEKPLAWMWVTEADLKRSGAREEDAEGLVNYALGMDGVEVAAFFRPTKGGFRVSLRSKDGFEVSSIAEEFGGGGHRQASGFSQPGALEAVMQLVLGRIRAGLGAPAGTALSVSSSAGSLPRTELPHGAAATTARTEPLSTGEI